MTDEPEVTEVEMNWLAVVILSEIGQMEPVLKVIATETDITGVTILSSRGVSTERFQQIVSDFSIGGAFSRLFEARKHQDRTIMIALRDRDELDQLEEILIEHVGDLSKPNTANLLAVPVEHSRGFFVHEGQGEDEGESDE